MQLDNLVCCSAKLTPLTMDRRGRRDRCGRIRSASCYEAECLKQKTSRGVDRGFVRVCGEGLAVSMALSVKLTMRQGQTMVLTPQLLQAIKLLQMPNLELTQFIENELASNPLLERAEEREEANPEPPDAHGGGFAEAPAEPGDWAAEAPETEAGHPAANLGTEVDNAFDADRTAPAVPSVPADGLSAHAWTGVGAGQDAGDAPD